MTKKIESITQYDLLIKSSTKTASEILSDNALQAFSFEENSVSIYSDGPVQGSERVARLIFSPIHIDNDDGTIKPTAFDDVTNKGLSINRCSGVDGLSLVHTLGKEKEIADNNKIPPLKERREYIGCAIANVQEIRNIKHESVIGNDDKNLEMVEPGNRIYAVLDTALQGNQTHADAFMVSILNTGTNVPNKKNLKRIAIKIISELFNLERKQ